MELEAFLIEHKLSLQEYSFQPETGSEYWHSNILDENNNPLAGGFGSSIEISRKIALAECLERMFYLSAVKTPALQMGWGLNLVSSGCGFAAGFDLRNTIIRSIGESIERWAMSKWIDEEYEMVRVELSNENISPATAWLKNKFEHVDFYKKSISILYGSNVLVFQVTVSVAILGTGVYLGSSVKHNQQDGFEHAILESFRHLLVVRNNTERSTFPENRIRFFSQNKEVALAAIAHSKKKDWPTPVINFHNHISIENMYYVARTIISGWIPWYNGPVSRFLY